MAGLINNAIGTGTGYGTDLFAAIAAAQGTGTATIANTLAPYAPTIAPLVAAQQAEKNKKGQGIFERQQKGEVPWWVNLDNYDDWEAGKLGTGPGTGPAITGPGTGTGGTGTGIGTGIGIGTGTGAIGTGTIGTGIGTGTGTGTGTGIGTGRGTGTVIGTGTGTTGTGTGIGTGTGTGVGTGSIDPLDQSFRPGVTTRRQFNALTGEARRLKILELDAFEKNPQTRAELLAFYGLTEQDVILAGGGWTPAPGVTTRQEFDAMTPAQRRAKIREVNAMVGTERAQVMAYYGITQADVDEAMKDTGAIYTEPPPGTPTPTPNKPLAVTEATATGYNPALSQVAPATDTVAGQVNSLLAKDNPFTTLSNARVAEEYNARGLINSSMRAGAAEKARIESVLPIASADAGFYAQQRMANQNFQNQALQFGAEAENKVRMFNAGQVNAFGLSAQEATQLQTLTAQKADIELQLQAFTGKQKADLSAQEANQLATLTAQKASIDKDIQTLKGQQQMALDAQNNAATKALQEQLQSMKGASAKEIAELERSGRNATAVMANVTDITKEAMRQLAELEATPNLTEKQYADGRKAITDQTNATLTLLSTISGIDLTAYLME